ncbi:hypothetical protein ES708_30106 [subsurface metagenome]
MEEQKRDLNGLIDFLNFAKKSGYVVASTGDNRIRIAKEVLTAVPNIDTTDVTKLDIDDVFSRYTTIMASKLPATTLQGNKSHLKSSIREFSTYLTDPLHYRPKSGKLKRDASSKPQAKKPPTAKKPPKAEITDSDISPPKQDVLPTPSLHIDIQVHISPQSSDTQIDKVFESMARHLKDLYKQRQSN